MQSKLAIISIIIAKYVQVLHKAFEVAPHGREVVVRDALLGAELPYDRSQFGKVHMVDAREEVVLDVVVDAALDEARDLSPAARCGGDGLVEEVLALGILLLARGEVDPLEAVDDDRPESLMETVADKHPDGLCRSRKPCYSDTRIL